MMAIYFSNIYRRMLMACLGVMLVCGLSACLPDSESVREKRLEEFGAGEALSYASALSSYLTQSHGALLRNAAFLDGTLEQGEIGRSLDAVLAHGYCREGTGGDINHMLIAWYTQTDRDGEFTVKGIGKGAGANIVQALAALAPPQMVGYYGDDEIRLRGPRRGGATDMGVPAGCGLDIPAGAPVLVVEHLSPSEQLGLAGGSYEYRTVSCENTDDIGARTERRTIATLEDGSVSRGGWEIYDDTCNGAVSTRAVSIERSIGNLIGALDLTDAGSLQGALNGLAGLDCVKVRTGEVQTDADGNEIEEGEVIADTCDTKNIDVTKYAADKDMTRTDEVRDREEMSVSCGAGQTGVQLRGRHSASYKGYTGSLNLHSGWRGSATYERFTFNAEQQGGGESAVDGLQKGLWRGHTLSCTRTETLTVDCYDVFPEYRGLQPVALGGMSVSRINRIEGWAVKSPPKANSPLNDSSGWYQAGASCEWIEKGSYGCCEKLGEGWESAGSGSKERNVRGVSIKGDTRTEWRDLGAAQCRKPYTYTWQECHQENCRQVTTTAPDGTTSTRTECDTVCVNKSEIRYYRGSTDLQVCEGIIPPSVPSENDEQTCEERGDCQQQIVCTTWPEICVMYQVHALRYPEADGAQYWHSYMVTLMERGMTREQALAQVEQGIKDTPKIIALAHGVSLDDFEAMLGEIPDPGRQNFTPQGNLLCTTASGGVDCFDPDADPVRATYVYVLQRMPDEEGYQYWQEKYSSGSVTMQEMMDGMWASPEGVAYAQTLEQRVYAERILATYIQETNQLPSDSDFEHRLQQLDAGVGIEQIKQEIAESAP